MKDIQGGVCAPLGFKAAGIHCGIRKNKSKKDLALIVSDVMCHAASTYTLNKVKGAPIAVTKQHLLNGEAFVIVVMPIHAIQMVKTLQMLFVDYVPKN